MRSKLVVIYGGTDLPDEAVRLVHHVVKALLAFPDIVIVTGGIVKVRRHPERIPTDRAVRDAVTEAAREAEGEVAEQLLDRLESWLPDRREDDRKDVVRDWAGATRKFDGVTAEGRRFALVLETDAIITFKGEVHTATVLELALRARKPALPIPFTGGDSERYWKKHRQDFQSRFKNAGELFDTLESTSLDALDAPRAERLAAQIAVGIARALDRWCLALMPFGEWGGEAFFEYVAKPVIEEAGYLVERLDQSSRAGHIPQTFLERLGRADAVLADITDANPNVMYEIGHVHGRRAAPFLFWRRAREQPPPELPFYFKPETFQLVDPADRQSRTGFAAALGDYLQQAVRSGMPRWPSDSSANGLRLVP